MITQPMEPPKPGRDTGVGGSFSVPGEHRGLNGEGLDNLPINQAICTIIWVNFFCFTALQIHHQSI